MTKRLFTFGCSYTRFIWPTWSTLLQYSFDEYENWAMSGGGNEFIFHSIIECDKIHNFNENDTIVIIWTSYHRFDRYVDGHWWGLGNIFNSGQNMREIRKYWSFKGAVLKSLNYIHATQKFLDAKHVNWFMSSMTDMGRVKGESDFDDAFIERNTDNIFSLYPELESWCDVFDNNWIYPPIKIFVDHKFIQSDYEFKNGHVDPHPTPKMYLAWLNDVFSPYSNIEISNEANVLVDIWESVIFNNPEKANFESSNLYMIEWEKYPEFI